MKRYAKPGVCYPQGGIRRLGAGKNGARVYYRETIDVVEVSGYLNKNNQPVVINRLKSLYEKTD